MVPGVEAAAIRVAAVIPAMLLILFSGLLWLLGLPCDAERRSYVLKASQQAMTTAGILLHGPAAATGQVADLGAAAPEEAAREVLETPREAPEVGRSAPEPARSVPRESGTQRAGDMGASGG